MRFVDSRVKLLDFVSKNGVCAEVGVYKGDFSEKILNICEPEKFFLIDGWDTIHNHVPSDTVGENIDCYDLQYWEKIRLSVFEKFKSFPNVKILCGQSIICLSSFPDDFFDFIYIDASHTYESCLSDLVISSSKLKRGGLLGGHDFTPVFPGVVMAVLEFVSSKQDFRPFAYSIEPINSQQFPSKSRLQFPSFMLQKIL